MQAIDAFEHYAKRLLEENQHYNLTALRTREAIFAKHFDDSLAIFDVFTVPHGAKVLDIGTGAGFPGLPMRIERPDLQLTLLDSASKKIAFVQRICTELQLQGVQTIVARADELAHSPAQRASYDLIVARAVDKLHVIAEIGLPFLRIGGHLVAFKGTAQTTQAELQQAKPTIQMAGAQLQNMQTQNTAYGERSFVVLKKISQSPPNLPRSQHKIARKPWITGMQA